MYEKERSKPPEALRKSSPEQDYYLALGFNSYEEYLSQLKSQPSIIPSKTSLKSIFDQDYDPAENQLIYYKEYIELKLKNFDFFEALDTTREKIDEWLVNGSEAVIDLFIKLVPKDSLSYHFLHIVKGASPHLVPMIWFVLGLLGGLIYLFLNLPTIKDKLLPQLTSAWKEFNRDREERGLEAALLKLKDSLSKALDKVVEHYSDRFQNANTLEEKEEILGELIAYGVITVQTVNGVSKLAVKGGKAVAKIPGKVPPQVRIFQERLSQQIEQLSSKLGPQKSAELFANLEKKAVSAENTASLPTRAEKQILKAGEEQLKQGISDKKELSSVPKEFEKTPAELAASWQGSGQYPGVDRWKNGILKKGTIVYGGVPGQGAFYTMKSTVRRSKLDATKVFEGLQVGPREFKLPDGTSQFKYRDGIMIYEVIEDTPAAFAIALKNTDWGPGGYGQIFVPNFSNVLKTVERLQLENIIAPEKYWRGR